MVDFVFLRSLPVLAARATFGQQSTKAQCRLYSLGRIPIHRPYKLWSGLKPQEVTKGYILASKRHLCSMLDTQFREFPFPDVG